MILLVFFISLGDIFLTWYGWLVVFVILIVLDLVIYFHLLVVTVSIIINGYLNISC